MSEPGREPQERVLSREAPEADSPEAESPERQSREIAGVVALPDPGDPAYYFNRELSWLSFNERVLEEALDPSNRLLERVKFLSIFASNLDEFFMVRVSGLRRQLEAGVVQAPPDGMTPAAQLAAIEERVKPLFATCTRCWHEELRPALAAEGIHVLSHDKLSPKQRKSLRQRFRKAIFPALTPLAFDPGHPFPHISNLSINLAVEVCDPERGARFARLKVPTSLPRLLRVPAKRKEGGAARAALEGSSLLELVWLEEVVAANLDLLFPGLEILSAHPFRVTRDADMEIEEDEASDLLEAMREVVEQRHFGSAVRLEVDKRMPGRIRKILTANLKLDPYQVFSYNRPLGLSDVMEVALIDRPDLQDPAFLPRLSSSLQGEEGVFDVLKRRDVLLYHPYDSFEPVVDLVRSAAHDPDVLAIKMTLYRIGPNSPIVAALMEARENGKQVSVLVELKARFDEATNIGWARSLERAGVHVVYGVLGLKTHAKMCLIVRLEKKKIVSYVHLATGNYNPVTAKVYTDLGFMTTNGEIAADVAELFNALTGYSRQVDYRKLLVAPAVMRRLLLERIEREISCHQREVSHQREGRGRLVFKMNSLVDKRCIQALYRASQAGVKVDLQVRGICCLHPGVAGLSENIRVTSIVGRFLEHSRIYYFQNGGDEEILVGSADLMPRNLGGRVEILFPIEDPYLLVAVRDEILFTHLRDNVQARELQSDGSWKRLSPGPGEERIDSQLVCLEQAGSWLREA